MNLLALTQRLWSESGRLGPGPSAITTTLQGDQLRAANRIRDAWRDLQMDSSKQWKWMRRTVTKPLTALQDTYTAAGWSITDFWRWWPETTWYMPEIVDAASNGNRIARLNWAPYEEFRELHQTQVGHKGLPVDWAIKPDKSLLVGPAPDQAWHIRLDYITKPTELVAGTDEPNMPEEFHLLLVWMALEQMAATDENAPEKVRATQNRRNLKALLMDDQAENVTLYHSEPLA